MKDSDCIFCKLAHGDIPTQMVYEDERIVCFKDQSPQADVHALIVPKHHYRDLIELAAGDPADSQAIFAAIPEIAFKLGIGDAGFRLINNCGQGAGQSVFHVHFHLLSDVEKLKEKLV